MATASLAAWLLVLQMLVGSFALAAELAPPRDALGTVICISHPDHSAPSDPHGGHKAPACCMLGCNFFSPILLVANSGDLLEAPQDARAEALGVESDTGPFARPETHPRNPRAPPLLG